MCIRIIALLMLQFACHPLFSQQLFKTDTLIERRDMSVLMLDGIDRFLSRRTATIEMERSKLWSYDFSSAANFNTAIQPQRRLLTDILGASQARLSSEMEVVSGPALKQLKIETPLYIMFAVKWRVLPGLWAEGLLLQPKRKTYFHVILVPDADILPESFAGLSSVPMTAGWGAALRLVQAGAEVLIPTLVSRDDTFSGNKVLNRFTNQPHREWIYRQAFEVGRHVIGYELLKIFSAVDWFVLKDSVKKEVLPIGMAGYGEGGLLALYAGAIDTRISTVVVSGYFGASQELHDQPIYRNVFGLLNRFGNAELAAMIWPRSLVIEHVKGPVVAGPPAERDERRGAAPGLITPIDSNAVREWRRYLKIIPTGANRGTWVTNTGKEMNQAFSTKTLILFCKSLHSGTQTLAAVPAGGLKNQQWLDMQQRQERTVHEMENDVQQELRRSGSIREGEFWQSIRDTNSIEVGKEKARQRFARSLGQVTDPLLPLRVESRILERTRKWTKYEVRLDVVKDIFAWGILMVPSDLTPGQKAPVVVCQHGLEGTPFDAVTTDTTAANYHYYRGFGTRLAERGYITFSPHNPYRGGNRFRQVQRKANAIGLTLYSIITLQHRRIVEWLSSQPFIDPSRIGFYGLSYGGKTAMYVPSQIKEYALSICSANFNEWILKVATTDYGWGYVFTDEYEMPEWDMARQFNYAEMAALVAPRPFMVERGLEDGVGTDDWVGFEFAKVSRHYLNIGRPSYAEMEQFIGGHTINGKGTFLFLDRFLKPEKR